MTARDGLKAGATPRLCVSDLHDVYAYPGVSCELDIHVSDTVEMALAAKSRI